MKTTAYISLSPRDTERLAGEFALALPSRACVALTGDLGSGKTCFVRGMAHALRITSPITSPTFTLVNEYRGTRSLVHMDLYRTGSPDELLSIGFDDYLDTDGLVLIEWAERAEDYLPPDTIWIRFRAGGDANVREIAISYPEA